MTKDELVARLHDIEWEDFEVKTAKSEVPKNIWESVSAFSNTYGSWIVLEVTQSDKKLIRNPTVAKLFRFVGIAENAGYGMNKLASWETLTSTRPTIKSNRTIATISFPLKSAIQRKTEDSNVHVDGAKTTLLQDAIISFMAYDSEITLDEIAKKISIGTATVDHELAKIAHLVQRVGSRNSGHWNLLTEN